MRYSRTTSFVAALVAIALVTAAGLRFRAARESDHVAQRVLVVEEESLDFGEVWAQKEFRWKLPLRNTSAKLIHIQGFVTSCNCSSVRPTSIAIPPGETRDVQLTRDLMSGDAGDQAQAVRGFTTDLVARLTGPFRDETVLRWRIRGRVRKSLSLDPGWVDYGEHGFGGAFEPKRADIKAHVPLARLWAEWDKSKTSADLVEATAGSNVYELHVTPSKDIPLGRFEIPVNIRAVTRTGEELPPIPLHIVGTVVGDVVVRPTNVFFPPAPLGTIFQETVVVSSRTKRNFAIEKVESESADVSISPAGNAPGGGRLFRVNGRVSQTGDGWRNVTFALRDAQGELTKATIRVYYCGLPANSGPELRTESVKR